MGRVKDLRGSEPEDEGGGAGPGAGAGFQEAGAEEGGDEPGPEGLLFRGGVGHLCSVYLGPPLPLKSVQSIRFTWVKPGLQG